MTNHPADDWDRHWTEISPASDIAPSTRYRRRVIERMLEIDAPGDGARVLEIGSGTGSFAELFVPRYPKARFLGLDLSATGVRMASRKIPSAEFRQRDLLKPAGPDDRTEFGATHALASEVLEHLDDPVTLLRNSMPYMAPGCRLIVTVPGGPISAFHEHIGHRRHYTPESLRGVLENAGFAVERAHGIGYPFFNLYLSLLIWRGEKAIAQVSGEPGLAVRAASVVFNTLFRFNSMKSGWQMVAVARYRG